MCMPSHDFVSTVNNHFTSKTNIINYRIKISIKIMQRLKTHLTHLIYIRFVWRTHIIFLGCFHYFVHAKLCLRDSFYLLHIWIVVLLLRHLFCNEYEDKTYSKQHDIYHMTVWFVKKKKNHMTVWKVLADDIIIILFHW